METRLRVFMQFHIFPNRANKIYFVRIFKVVINTRKDPHYTYHVS